MLHRDSGLSLFGTKMQLQLAVIIYSNRETHVHSAALSSYVVCLSVGPSMTLIICDHIILVTSKVITWIIILESLHLAPQHRQGLYDTP